MATIITSDHTVFDMNDDFVNDCKILKLFIDDNIALLPLPNIDTQTFRMIQFFSVHGYLENYEKIINIIMAADYMSYDRLIEHCAEYIATTVIKDMSPEQIKKYFENM